MKLRRRTALLAVALGAGSARAALHEVAIRDMRFEPELLRIRVGDTVRWTNREKRTSHSLLFKGQPESERLFPGESLERRFDQDGEFDYFCGPHPEMKGRVVVE
ncbi:MAG: cupredoxin domain-containing protein [Burkholderiales bacterium]|uniref:cupredoxin domain-containing protein n=1 Tax=Inhella sp. TaxID=1921806 RepID=UPI001AC3DFE4|nr:cupredoxin domain-containing protein [Burkholderiales bacterium]